MTTKNNINTPNHLRLTNDLAMRLCKDNSPHVLTSYDITNIVADDGEWFTPEEADWALSLSRDVLIFEVVGLKTA